MSGEWWLAVLVANTVGLLLGYLSLPQQGWREQPLPALPARLPALLLWCLGLVLLSRGLAPLAAIFAQLVISMLLLALLPLLSLLVPARRYSTRRRPCKASRSAEAPAEKPVRARIRADWWRKSLAGVLLGLPLALALAGLLAWWGPGGIEADNKVQFVMWMIAPIWMLLLGLVYLFANGWRAIVTLASANTLAYVALLAARGG